MESQSEIGNRRSAIRVSAPGSLMLLGEHAVLHGRRALVCAINRRMTVSLTPLKEPVLKISSVLGEYEAPLGALTDHPDLRFVLDAVQQYPSEQGVELTINSEFSSDIGFGSSAAVTVAVHAALMKHSGGANSPNEQPYRNDGSLGEFALPLHAIFRRSLATIHRVQGRGSGADVAASVFGGVVAYRADPLEIHKVEQASRLPSASGRFACGGKRTGRPFYSSFPLTAVYSGSKMKTADVIKIVEERRALNPDDYEKIFDRMDASVGEVVEGFSTLGKKLIENQFFMEEMGLCNAALAEIISRFREKNIPAKISGSGLGDCVVGLGPCPSVGSFPVYPLRIDPQGICRD